MKTHSLLKTCSVSLMLAGAMALGSSAFAQETAKPKAHDTKPMAGADGAAMKSTLTAQEMTFAKKAAIGNMAEVKLGEMAQSKAESADVKSFGQQMVTDHGKANENLMAAASKKGLTLEPKLDAKHEAVSEKLGKLSGAAFDKAYVAAMVKDHMEDAAEYKTAIASIKDEDLKSYATTTLPIVEHHLEMAKEMHGKMGGSMEKMEKTEKK